MDGNDNSPDNSKNSPSFGWQSIRAEEIRQGFLAWGYYPHDDRNGDELHDIYENHVRKHLPQMIEQIKDRNDLFCLYRLIELWSKHPPTYFVNEPVEKVMEKKGY